MIVSLYIVKKLLKKHFKEKYYRTYFLISSCMLSLIYIFLETEKPGYNFDNFLVVLFFIIFFDKNIFKLKRLKLKKLNY